MKVRIKTTPVEHDVDGIKLDQYLPGTVREVSPSLGSWLIAGGYAEPEMRGMLREEEEEPAGLGSGISDFRAEAADLYRRKKP